MKNNKTISIRGVELIPYTGSPTIEIVEIQTEKGFAGSGWDNIGDMENGGTWEGDWN